MRGDQLFVARGAGALPDGRQSAAEWLSTFTKNESVHAIFRNLCAAIFACNADELTARAFLACFVSKGAFKRFGFCPSGTIGVWRALADAANDYGAGGTQACAETVKLVVDAIVAQRAAPARRTAR